MIDDIIVERERLDRLLMQAVATMEKKDTIDKIRSLIRINQNNCPHFSSKYNYVFVDDTCPYCGKKHCFQNKEE